MDKKTKMKIDAMNYEEMLSLWRYATVAHPWFVGDTGDYFARRMAEERTRIGADAAALASKSIGWR